MSSYCACTALEVASAIGVSEQIAGHEARSARGSITCTRSNSSKKDPSARGASSSRDASARPSSGRYIASSATASGARRSPRAAASAYGGGARRLSGGLGKHVLRAESLDRHRRGKVQPLRSPVPARMRGERGAQVGAGPFERLVLDRAARQVLAQHLKGRPAEAAGPRARHRRDTVRLERVQVRGQHAPREPLRIAGRAHRIAQGALARGGT